MVKATEKLTGKQAIEKVLNDMGPTKQHSIKEVLMRALPLTSLGGATPLNTLSALAYTEAKNDEPKWTIPAPGKIKLKRGRRS
ncbi:MAG TPA: hypothetical protein VFB25_10780 [Gaiellaceae bacterium]|nr:hypothetical protein [Gaiellaceae bacterium]